MRSMLPTRARRPVRWTVLTMLVSQLVLVGAAPAMAKEPDLDHFNCYRATGKAINEKVALKDQFSKQFSVALVGSPVRFCNPAAKVHDNVLTKIKDFDAHLTFYRISPVVHSSWSVKIHNQFGTQKLVAGPAIQLAVPTHKVLGNHEAPVGLDHFKCYQAKGDSVGQSVLLRDQFKAAQVRVANPVLFCNPTAKIHDHKLTKIEHPEAHLACYRTAPLTHFSKVVPVVNQFGKAELRLSSPNMLCVPSFKLGFQPLPVG